MSQHMDALRVANERRLAAAELRHEVADGTLSLADAIVDERAGSLTVTRLLAAQMRWGETRAERVCAAIPCRVDRRVRELTDRQRERVLRFAAMTPSEIKWELRMEHLARRDAA